MQNTNYDFERGRYSQSNVVITNAVAKHASRRFGVSALGSFDFQLTHRRPGPPPVRMQTPQTTHEFRIAGEAHVADGACKRAVVCGQGELGSVSDMLVNGCMRVILV